jgi:xanthine dehydrogenase accessory factor
VLQLAPDKIVVIKGGGDVGSAVAHLLYQNAYRPVIVESPTPSTTRRRMAFATAVFEGEAELAGVRAERVDSIETLRALLHWGKVVPVFVGSVEAVLVALSPGVVVDARMRKREIPEPQIEQAPLVIGLGPGFRAGETVHVVIETNRGPHLGRVITEGSAEPYTGEPISIAGYKRERYSYAPVSGTFHTTLDVGMMVQAGDVLGRIGSHEVRARVSGLIRGITKDGIGVFQGTKIAEVDPRGQAEFLSGIAERPRRIAEGVLEALRRFR